MRTTPIRAAILLACIHVLLILSPAAAAREDAARGLQQAAVPYKGWALAALRLEGVPDPLWRTLRDGLALAGRPRLGGLLGRKRPALTPALLQQDADRILLFLARHGYPNASISASAQPHKHRRRVDLLLRVETGAPVLVGEVELVGLAGADIRQGALRDQLPQPGDLFSDDQFQEAARRVEAALRAVGHVRADCRAELESLDSSRLRLTYHARPGPLCRIDSLRVSGVEPDLTRLAERSLGYLQGQVGTPLLLAGAQDRLRLLGVFRQIRFGFEDPPDLDAKTTDLDLKAELAPRQPRTLEAGAGWWTAEGGRLSSRWSHANLFKGGRGLQLSVGASRVRQTGRAESWWPAMVAPTLRGEVTLMLDRQREDSYGLLNRELRLGLRQQPTLLLTLSGGVSVGEVKVDGRSPDSLAFQAQPGRQTVFSAAALRNTTDNPLDPTHGSQSGLQLHWTVPGFFSTADFLHLEVEQTAYRSHASITGAARLRLGLAWPLGSSRDLLPNRRFFAGGMDQRGFGRNRLGPRDVTGSALGGEAMALGSLELRLPLVWKLRAALFLDAGQVWRRPEEMSARDVELAAGPALLLTTPIGPVRGDVGFRLGAADDDMDRWALHVSIGHPF